MFARVLTHINHLASSPNGLKSGFYNGFRFAYKGDNRAVGGLARVHIQKFYAFNGFNGICDLSDDCRVAPL